MKLQIKECIDATLASLENTFDNDHHELLETIVDTVATAIRSGHKLLLCGNGGSAADSQHIAAEFVARFKKERSSYPAIALTTDTSILTSIGNDYSFEDIFSRQVEGLGRKDDVLIGISTSGNSPNVLKAIEIAKSKGIKTIAFTGKSGGKIGATADMTFAVNSTNTPHIQAGHIIALHTVCEYVENVLVDDEEGTR